MKPLIKLLLLFLSTVHAFAIDPEEVAGSEWHWEMKLTSGSKESGSRTRTVSFTEKRCTMKATETVARNTTATVMIGKWVIKDDRIVAKLATKRGSVTWYFEPQGKKGKKLNGWTGIGNPPTRFKRVRK